MSDELNDKQRFIVSLYPAAMHISKETGMSWQLILAQAAQETGWGQKVLPGTNNIFNIKAYGGWDGPSLRFDVPERENGKTVIKNEPFRVYGSIEESLRDRIEFLRENPRYTKAGLFEPGTLGNFEKEAQALQRGKYATDENYVQALQAVFNGPTMQKAIAYAQAHPQQGSSDQRPHSPAPGGSGSHTPASPMADGQLKRGEEGPEIKHLQERLNKLGYGHADGTPLVANGKFGPNTEAAVIKFQQEHGLQGLGVVGPKTFAALDAAEKAQTQGGHPPARPPVAEPAPKQPQQGGIELIAAHALTLKYDDVTYKMGAKNPDKGRVDCSGWVAIMQNATMDEINQKAGHGVFSAKDKFSLGNDGAAMIVEKAEKRSGVMLEGKAITAAALKEGMVIGEDNGLTSNERKNGVRYKSIDHITMVVRDPKTDQLMISQSNGSQGVNLMPVEDYLKYKQSKHVHLFATDPIAEARSLLKDKSHAQGHPDHRHDEPSTTPKKHNGGDISWPAPGNYKINQADKHGEGAGEFGTSREGGKRHHKGIDIEGDVGDQVKSFASGKVIAAYHWKGTTSDSNEKAGNFVKVDHGNGVVSTYMHLNSINVKLGQEVEAGTKIGTMGRTGNTPHQGDTHLHFEIRKHGVAVDPMPYLKGAKELDAPTKPHDTHPKQGDKGATPASPMADGQLKRGEEGPEIKHLQERLNKLGYGHADGTPLVTNGKFGPNTEAAVIKFQQEHGLQGLGVVGPKTLAALDAAEKAQAQGGMAKPDASPHHGNTPPKPDASPYHGNTPPKPDASPYHGNTPPKPDASPHHGNTPPKPDASPHPHVDAHAGKLLLTNPQHPDNKLYQQALSTLEQLGPSGGFKSREEMEKAAAAVAADAKLSGLTQIDHITRSKNGEGLIAIQGADPWSDTAKRAFVERSQAVNQTVEQSSEMVNAKAAEKAALAQPQPTEQLSETPKRAAIQQ